MMIIMGNNDCKKYCTVKDIILTHISVLKNEINNMNDNITLYLPPTTELGGLMVMCWMYHRS